MIVCSCRALSDRALRDAVARGLSPEEVVAASGAGSDCGACRDLLADLVAEARCGCDQGCDRCPRRVRA